MLRPQFLCRTETCPSREPLDSPDLSMKQAGCVASGDKRPVGWGWGQVGGPRTSERMTSQEDFKANGCRVIMKRSARATLTSAVGRVFGTLSPPAEARGVSN